MAFPNSQLPWQEWGALAETRHTHRVLWLLLSRPDLVGIRTLRENQDPVDIHCTEKFFLLSSIMYSLCKAVSFKF